MSLFHFLVQIEYTCAGICTLSDFRLDQTICAAFSLIDNIDLFGFRIAENIKAVSQNGTLTLE